MDVYRVRTRLKDILRQYELRERHFECVIRSKELEVLLSRARAAEQKQLAEGEKARAERVEEEACHHLCLVIHSPSSLGRTWFLFLEPATPEGAGRRAEGSDDAIRAADIVLQRGTLLFFSYPQSVFSANTRGRSHAHIPSPA